MAGEMLRSIADLGDVRDREEVVAEVPEWGTRIRFQTPTLEGLIHLDRERAKLGDSPADRVESLILAIAAAAVDDGGEPIFASEEARAWLRKRNGDVLLRLGRIAAKVAGADSEEVESVQGESGGTLAEG